MRKTIIKLKNGTSKEGKILEFRPDLGDISIIFQSENMEKPEEIDLQDISSCMTYNATIQRDGEKVVEDVDVLSLARELGWVEELGVNFAGRAVTARDSSRDLKLFHSKNYNFVMNYKTGYFARWGKTKEHDPVMSVFGPELADIEISTICHGIQNKPCKFCYKSNTGKGEIMTLETFKKIFSKFPETLTQIAFGIGDIDANPDMWAIFEHCREHEVVPNVTINGDRATREDFDKLTELCGAVAVSRYQPTDVCYNAIEALTSRGLKQVNIHMLLAQETYEECLKLLMEAKTDPRLKDLNAIVFLALKERGRGTCMHSLRSVEKYRVLVSTAFELGVRIGFDSCSAPIFLKSVQDHANYEKLYELSEPCESTLFSIYVDVKGNVWPCSFLEKEEYWPINLLEVEDFVKDCWHSEKLNKFRYDLLGTIKDKEHPCLVEGVRECPKYNLYLDF